MTQPVQRSGTGPGEASNARPTAHKIINPITEFKELIRVLSRPRSEPAAAAGPLSTGREIEPSAAPSGGVAPAVSASGRSPPERTFPAPLDEPGRSEAQPSEWLSPPPSLEPYAVLLGSLSAFQGEVVAPAAAGGALPERLASEIVRSIAWGGDRRRGAARIELGGEQFGGTRLVIEVDGDRLRLSLDAPPGVDADALRARLSARLERRGLHVVD